MLSIPKCALVAIALSATSACTTSRGDEPKPTAAPPTQTQPAARPMTEEERQREIEKRTKARGQRAAIPGEPVSPQNEPPPVVGEVPDELLAQIRSDLAGRIGDAAAKARLVRAEQVLWPDGSIGCAQPGRLYVQITVPGYLVEFEVDDKRYRYHAPLHGGATYCERPGTYLHKLGPAQ
jgi:hypothetical protein